MIFLRLTRHEAELGHLPAACVRCGAPAFVWQTRRLREQRIESSAVFYAALPLVYAIAAAQFLADRPPTEDTLARGIAFAVNAAILVNVFGPWFAGPGFTVRLPFCLKHHLHWFKRTVYDLICILFLPSLVLGSMLLPPIRSPMLMGLHLLQWMSVKTVDRHRAIQINEITDRSVTLRGIHPKFRDALFDWRHGFRESAIVSFDSEKPPPVPEAMTGVQP